MEPPVVALTMVGQILRDIGFRVTALWVALSALDYFVQRKQIDKQLRMTKQEVKQEMKEQEQSPELRAARARRRRQLGKKRLRDAVAMADA